MSRTTSPVPQVGPPAPKSVDAVLGAVVSEPGGAQALSATTDAMTTGTASAYRVAVLRDIGVSPFLAMVAAVL